VDSAAGVEAATQGVARAAGDEPVDAFLARGLGVAVDVGYAGGRTGCRTDEDALAIAAAVSAAPGLRLAGIAGYEGGLGDVQSVELYLRRVQHIANTLHERGQLADDGIVSCGGSAYFDLVATVWADGWRSRFTPHRMLRSGAYITHDDGVYVHKTPFNRIAGRLEAAIQVWAQVISPGDAGRVIVGMGKRDAPYDEGMPVPRVVRRRGADVIEELTGASVEKMDDQHAYVLGETPLQPGDLIGFGISHPCTAFDTGRLIPVLDDDHRVVDVVRTYF
jgi:D-serine deaminase-like pyridoxal phosphate-dependent protein